MKTLPLPRSLWILMGDFAASSRIISTMLRASAKACSGVSQPALVEAVAARQHRQNPRREMAYREVEAITFSQVMSSHSRLLAVRANDRPGEVADGRQLPSL